MSFFHSFLQGAKLTEFLIEGHNPDARHKLSTADVDALRQHMKTGEALKAFVTGRIVGSGAGVWVVTEQQVLLRNTALESVACVKASDVNHFEAILGRYGHTVRLSAQGRQFSMYVLTLNLLARCINRCKRLGFAAHLKTNHP